MSNQPQTPVQEVSVGSKIGDIQNQIDGLYAAISDLDGALETVSVGDTPATAVNEGKPEHSVKVVAELSYVADRIETAKRNIVEMNARLRL